MKDKTLKMPYHILAALCKTCGKNRWKEQQPQTVKHARQFTICIAWSTIRQTTKNFDVTPLKEVMTKLSHFTCLGSKSWWSFDSLVGLQEPLTWRINPLSWHAPFCHFDERNSVHTHMHKTKCLENKKISQVTKPFIHISLQLTLQLLSSHILYWINTHYKNVVRCMFINLLPLCLQGMA